MKANNKRLIIWTVIAGIVLLGLTVAFYPRSVPVDIVSVAREAMTVTVDEDGETRIHDVFVLSAPVAGRLQRINASVGDTVVAGETVLARIEPGDPTLLDPRSEAQIRAEIRAAESAHTLALAEVEKNTAELDFARAELARARELVSDGTISQRDLDQATRNHETAKATLATARAALQMRLFELEQSRASLLSPLQTQTPHEVCECVPITAPVSGRVLTIANKSERVVAAGEALLEIGDPADLEIVVDFLSVDAVKMKPGQRVVVDGWGGDSPLTGQVRRVEPFGFTKVSALGIEEQRVNVLIDFLDPPEKRALLGHGFQVEAHVVLWESDSALTIPLTALFRSGKDWAVFVDDRGTARMTQVMVGRRNGLVSEITGGLAEGDRVVLHPSDRIHDGVKIVQRHEG